MISSTELLWSGLRTPLIYKKKKGIEQFGLTVAEMYDLLGKLGLHGTLKK
jgi:hypothetical protein